MSKFRSLSILFVTLLCLTLLPVRGADTIVRFNTVLGSFDVHLYDRAKPITVANFLTYMRDGSYDDTFFHRSLSSSIIQGGGYGSTGGGFFPIETNPPITNEPGLSNVRGTIAMAKIGGDPNSATSQWFFNLTNNAAVLDAQNGGFTVFGRVLGGGMQVVDALGAVPSYNFSGVFGAAFANLPLLANTFPLPFVEISTIEPVQVGITNIEYSVSSVKLDWTAPLATGVNVERSTNFVTGGWQVVSTNNTNSTFTDTNAPAGQAYYRLAIP